MKRAISVVSAVALVAAMAWVAAPESRASCTFQSPIKQGGLQGRAPTFVLTTGNVGGFFWEQGFGDPADGPGNDTNSVLGFLPAGADNQWISRDPGNGNARVDYNWLNGGIDGCLSSNLAGVGTMVFYILDDLGNYAIASVNGVATPIASHDLDTIGQDIQLRPLAAFPAINVTAIVDDFSVVADVGGPRASVNCYDDGNGQCDDPLTFQYGTQLISRTPGGGGEAPVPGCDAGCTGVTLARDTEYCWDSNMDGLIDSSDQAIAVGSTQPGTGAICQGGLGDGLPCDPNDPAGFCPAFAGVCPTPPDVVLAFGPPIPSECLLIAGPTVSDTVSTTPARNLGKGLVGLSWNAEQFTIDRFEIVGRKANGREQVIRTVLRMGLNDGTLQDYEEIVSRGDLKGAKDLVLRTFLTDSSSFDTAF